MRQENIKADRKERHTTATTMGNQFHKVVYKPDSMSTDEYMVVVNKAEVCISSIMADPSLTAIAPFQFEKWKAGGKPIIHPLLILLLTAR